VSSGHPITLASGPPTAIAARGRDACNHKEQDDAKRWKMDHPDVLERDDPRRLDAVEGDTEASNAAISPVATRVGELWSPRGRPMT
jgi:hypothetical protein